MRLSHSLCMRLIHISDGIWFRFYIFLTCLSSVQLSHAAETWAMHLFLWSFIAIVFFILVCIRVYACMVLLSLRMHPLISGAMLWMHACMNACMYVCMYVCNAACECIHAIWHIVFKLPIRILNCFVHTRT